jgi:hypothetical protein
VTDARASERETRKLDRIRAIESAGHTVKFLVHRHGMTQDAAYEVEAALIDMFPDALNEVEGHHSDRRGAMTLEEVIANYDPPAISIAIPAVLINIAEEWLRGLGADPEKLYERTRQYWRCNPGNYPDVKYAFAVSKGIIRAAFAIDGPWQRHDMGAVQYDSARIATPSHKTASKVRWGFSGRPAAEMRDLVGLKVSQTGGQNPITWVNTAHQRQKQRSARQIAGG